ncbi:MAG: mechanosensitive ion channel [Chthoniobacterales bacterium]|nr:mechanosensitive ion channel [Chthoniobacterales bacterium]
MNDFASLGIANLRAAIFLAVGFPLALLVLNEASARCRRAGLPIARTFATLRNLVVPSLALLVFARHVAQWPAQGTAVRVIESVFWIALLYAVLGLVNDVVFGAATKGSWSERVPKLFRDLVRALLVAVGAMVIYSQVWGHEISAALTALGLGSIVIGLALQEPLGNIVSGLMLLFERPLAVGDWVLVDGVRGKVIEINWRSVHIETPTRELQVVPNVVLYKGTFANLSRPTPLRTEIIEIGFSYDDPPNRVKEVMQQLLESTPGVLADPAPLVRTVNYADFSVIYRLIFSVESQAELAAVRDNIMTRLWYVARRDGLTIPFPIQMEYSPGENPGPAAPTPAELLRAHPRFAPALQGAAGAPAVLEFAAGEMVHDPARRLEGFALVIKGRASLLSTDAEGRQVEIGSVGPGEAFGDQVTAGGSADNIAVAAAEDLKIILFDNEAIGGLLNRSPSLASEIGDAIESRRQAAQVARRRK